MNRWILLVIGLWLTLLTVRQSRLTDRVIETREFLLETRDRLIETRDWVLKGSRR